MSKLSPISGFWMCVVVRQRTAVRGVMMTPAGEVLMMQFRLPWVSEPVWSMPGGGMEAGETPEHCLIREIAEETGLTGISPGPRVWHTRFNIVWEGRTTDVTEFYYLVPVEPFTPVTDNFEPYEHEWFGGFRWWTAAELASSGASFTPAPVADLIAELLQSPPGSPVFIDRPLPPTYLGGP
ncbi:MAG: NUDIX domain-containing protein [Pseudomonadales bacterium]|nr:NUDIX domain-containing protein [Pseudomonadales bacterium]